MIRRGPMSLSRVLPLPGDLWQVCEHQIEALHPVRGGITHTYALLPESLLFVIDTGTNWTVIWCDDMQFQIENDIWLQLKHDGMLQLLSPSGALP